jgi:hypothetical protein
VLGSSRPFVGNVTVPIAHFVSLKVSNMVRAIAGCGLFTAIRKRASVTTLRVVLIVYMTAEMAIAMKPRAGAPEYTANEPLRAVVAVG